MAVRLPVLMVHTPPASAAAQQMAEAVIGELIGRPGIDMVLIGSTSELADDSTDRITLDSLTGDTAVLDWRTPDEIVAGLQRNGLPGVRAAHTHDAEVPANRQNGRKIYAFDLRRFSDAAHVAAAVMQLNQSRQVRTFTLSPLGLTTPNANKTERATTQADPEDRIPDDRIPDDRVTGERNPEPVQPEADLSPPPNRRPPANIPAQKPLSPPAEPRSADTGDGEGIDLDDLLDQLDQSDP